MLDAQYLHLHHAEIFRLLEKGRLGYLEHIELPQEALLELDCFLVLTSSSIEFLREIQAGELNCTVKMKGFISDSEFSLEQELYKHPKRLAVKACFNLLSMSGRTRRRIPIPGQLKEKLLPQLD